MESTERAEIVSLLKKGTHSHREIARKFNRSQSTISAIAKDAAITPPKKLKRTPQAPEVEGTFSREERISVADSAVSVIAEMLKGGGLSPRDLRETTQSLKVALEARRLEDIEPEEEKKQESRIWVREFEGDGEDGADGFSYDPSTPLGKQLLAFHMALESEDIDVDDWGAIKKREAEIADELKAAEGASEPEGSDDG